MVTVLAFFFLFSAVGVSFALEKGKGAVVVDARIRIIR